MGPADPTTSFLRAQLLQLPDVRPPTSPRTLSSSVCKPVGVGVRLSPAEAGVSCSAPVLAPECSKTGKADIVTVLTIINQGIHVRFKMELGVLGWLSG